MKLDRCSSRWASAIVVVWCLLKGSVLWAANFSPMTVAQLAFDIGLANSNGASDIIDLGGATFTLTAIDNVTDGNNGWHSSLSDGGNPLTLQNGAIERSGASNFRLLHVSSGATLRLSGTALRNGSLAAGAFPDTCGAAVLNRGALTIQNATTLSGNASAGSGGAICNLDAATLQIFGSTLSSNTAAGNGGAVYNVGSVTGITNATFSANTATGDGGAIYNEGSISRIANTTVAENSGDEGGGIF